MPIHLTHGDLLQSNAQALVNPVNCVGVMGRGLALQFKQAWPANFRAYAKACKAGAVVPGRMFIHAVGERFIVNFPTKRHWRDASRLEDIEAGLVALVVEVRRLGIRSVAIPPLGCGLGGRTWAEVRPRIEAAFVELPDVEVWIYAPDEASPVP